MKYTVVSMYFASEQVMVDHIEADHPSEAVSRTYRVVAEPLSVFEGHHTDLYIPPEEDPDEATVEDAGESRRDCDEQAQQEEIKLLADIASKRSTDWSYERRWKDERDSAGVLEFEDELVDSHGAHFHIWVPKSDPSTEATLIQQSVQALRRNRDVISWSWDYIPAEVP